MDYDRVEERLLWLEAQGAAVAAEARRLRRRARRVALVDADDLAREVARLGVVAQVRADEVEVWRAYVEPPPAPEPRPVPMPAPLRRWWWLW